MKSKMKFIQILIVVEVFDLLSVESQEVWLLEIFGIQYP